MFFSKDTNQIHITADNRRLTVIPEDDIMMPLFTGFGMSYQRLIVLELSKAAREMLMDLIEKRSINTNEAPYVVRDPSAKTKTSKAYKELKGHRIVVRVRKQTYLLNPEAVIPKRKHFDQIQTEWRKHA